MLVLRMIKVFKASKVKGDQGHVSLCMGVKIVCVFLTRKIFPVAKKRKLKLERVSFTGLVKGGRGGQKTNKKETKINRQPEGKHGWMDGQTTRKNGGRWQKAKDRRRHCTEEWTTTIYNTTQEWPQQQQGFWYLRALGPPNAPYSSPSLVKKRPKPIVDVRSHKECRRKSVNVGKYHGTHSKDRKDIDNGKYMEEDKDKNVGE